MEKVKVVPSELWAEGSQDCEACIFVDDYGQKLVCWASVEDFTSSQMVKALEEKYPDVTFDTRLDISPGTVYAVGKRQL